jgi:gluconate 2-dehydrogenase gamma chain
MSEKLSRREFMIQSAVYGTAVWLLGSYPRPLAARAAQASAIPKVLSKPQWQTVEAITSRVIPTDHEPGALEANCVNFIDKALLHEDAQLKPIYRIGLKGIDSVSGARFGKTFTELTAQQQDIVLAALESAQPDGWPEAEVAPNQFFQTVRQHTIIGFLADPKYGGNRDYVGWQVSGYPGPRHALGGYTPEQMIGKEKIITVWGKEV